MKGSPKKIAGFLKAAIPFIIEHWPKIAILLSGVTVTGILAGLAHFFGFFARLIKLRIELPLLTLIAIFPIIAYAAILAVMKIVGIFRKPRYLSFASMEYRDTKNNLYKLKWDYELYNKKYVVRNIRPICLDCGCELTEINSSGLYCPICRNIFYEAFNEDKAVKKIIEHKNSLSAKNKIADKHSNQK